MSPQFSLSPTPIAIDPPAPSDSEVVWQQDYAVRADTSGPELYNGWRVLGKVPISTNITFEYNEPVFAGSGRIIFRNEAGAIVLAESPANSTRITIAGKLVTLDPPADLAYSTTFRVEFEAGFVKDASGNGSVATVGTIATVNNPLPLKLVGTAGPDDLRGGDANDVLRGEAGDDKLQDYDGDDFLDGGEGNDTIITYGGEDILSGGNGNDTLIGKSPLREFLFGGAGDDFLEGGEGDDRFDGGSGNDTIELSAWPGFFSSNTVDGGTGNDVILVHLSDSRSVKASGGDGVDTFVVKTVDVHDGSVSFYGGILTISDFVPGAGGDLIDLSAIMPDDLGHSNPFGTLGYLRLSQVGNDTIVQFNGTTNSPSQTVVKLSNTDKASVTADNFVQHYNPAGINDGIVFMGTERGDGLGGAATHDFLYGLGGNDLLYGAPGNDLLDGGEGNDVLDGGPGNNVLIGGNGRDTARYNALLGETSIIAVSDGWLVRSGAATVKLQRFDDTLSGVERLAFRDARWALDIDGTAGKVYRIYQAAFDRTPDQAGLGYWIKQADSGLPLLDIASGFVQSAEFVALYGAGPTNSDLVARFYQNVLHRKPDPLGEAYWIGVLDQHQASVPEVLEQFSESPENQAAVAQIIGNGFSYQVYV